MRNRMRMGLAASNRTGLTDTNYSHGHTGSVRLWQRRLIFSIIITIPILYFAISDFLAVNLPLSEAIMSWEAPLSFLLSTIAIIYLGGSFFRSTIRGLKQRVFNIDSLITIGTTTAYVFSLISYILYFSLEQTIFVEDGNPKLYFSTVVFLFVFVVLGKWLEARATSKAELSVKQLLRLRPQRTHLINGNNISDIPVDQVRIGDYLLVRPGETIPVDGRVTSGDSTVNESMITGESLTADKHIGSTVIAGTLNGNGELEIIAQRIGENTMLARIIRLVSGAQQARTSIENVADRIANIFVPAVITSALVSFAIWYFYFGVDISSAMMMFVTVLMVACPCAFGLAAPTAITAGISLGSKNGILIRKGSTLQQLRKVDTVVFDKTGTLTNGQPVVTDIQSISIDTKQALAIAASLERCSDHSLAKAIIKKADDQHLQTVNVRNPQAIAGRGVEGIIGNTKHYLGNEAFILTHLDIDLPDTTKLAKAGKHACYLFTKRKLLAVIAVADQPKVHAARTIRQLHQMNITTYLLSGDNETTASTIAKRLGIKNVIADVMPDAKASEVLSLRRAGHCVAMVGDGINDTPAIASANVGIAVGTGADAAIETGDVILVNGDPLGICAAIRLSRITTNKIYQNLFFSMFYNIVSIPIAAGALTAIGITMPPELAGLIMVLSIAAVVINSLVLKLTDINKRHEPIRIIAPIVLILLFTVLYIEFIIQPR
ncbi:MAG: copper-translocating P-type ATPase [Candidatus Saccharibacteria bacterium]|nr:copper-translocating P-type ATPase [Candidatus Saccharibacteria bacterium]